MTNSSAASARGTRRNKAETPRRRFVRRFTRRHLNLVSLGFLLLVIVSGLLAQWLAPHDPLAQDVVNRRLPPFSPDHLLGTDNLGRDTLSRLLYGSRVAVQAAVISVGIGLGIGLVPALIAGYLGGWWDGVLSRIADTLLSFPPLLLAMAIVGVMGPNLTNAMTAVGIIFAPRFFRVVRSAVLSVREETYIEASRSMGTPTHYILRRHVLPNALSPLIVQISLACGFAILAEASLSFLTLGVTPPEPSWGRMLAEGREAWFYTPWLTVIPAVAIVLTVLACNLMGDGIRDSVGRETRDAG
ncbi:ABC transporter permease [Nocardioides sp. Bht2]|uniref:ABC transporter permease n=1 Tax=Nocardioides sp. Bht2 TaxID=3392297 RepID=UPI0039B40D10